MSRGAVLGMLLLIGCSPFGSDDPATTPEGGTPVDADATRDGGTPDAGGSAYAAAVLADRPLLYWRLGDAAGDFFDASGNGHRGRPSPTVARSQPSLLSGNDEASIHVVVGSSVDSDPAEDLELADKAPYTIECWVRIDAIPTTDTDIVTRADASSGIGLFFEGNSSKVLSGRHENGAGANHGGREITLGEPHHIVTTYDGESMRLYIDGTTRAPTDLTKDPTRLGRHPFPVMIGRVVSGQADLDGWVDEVAIYGVALSDERIGAHAALGGAKAK